MLNDLSKITNSAFKPVKNDRNIETSL